MTSSTLRAAIGSLIRHSDPDLNLSWGWALTGREYEPDCGWGLLEVVTPNERLPLTRSLLEAANGRLMMTGGMIHTRLFLPDELDHLGLYHYVPAIEVRLIAETTRGTQTLDAQIPWQIAAESPLAILTVGPLPGWPR